MAKFLDKTLLGFAILCGVFALGTMIGLFIFSAKLNELDARNAELSAVLKDNAAAIAAERARILSVGNIPRYLPVNHCFLGVLGNMDLDQRTAENFSEAQWLCVIGLYPDSIKELKAALGDADKLLNESQEIRGFIEGLKLNE